MLGIFGEFVEVGFLSERLLLIYKNYNFDCSTNQNDIFRICYIYYLIGLMTLHLAKCIWSKWHSRAVIFEVFGTWESDDISQDSMKKSRLFSWIDRAVSVVRVVCFALTNLKRIFEKMDFRVLSYVIIWFSTNKAKS